jgi:hypothetical protein
MATGFAGGVKISERLHESLARIDRVELWASALEGFSRPIPDYDASRRYRLSACNGGAKAGVDAKNHT